MLFPSSTYAYDDDEIEPASEEVEVEIVEQPQVVTPTPPPAPVIDEHQLYLNKINNYTQTLTKSMGVYYFNGKRETYYSSRVLYHYRTSE